MDLHAIMNANTPQPPDPPTMSDTNTQSASLVSLAPKALDKSDKLEKPEKEKADKSDKPAGTESSKSSTKVDKDKNGDGTGVEELAMPRTMITRLAKSALPPGTQLQRDAVLAISKSATLFINHVASLAQDDLAQSGKKTIQPLNVFAALEESEFAWMKPALDAELEKFVAIQSNKREEYKKKTKDKNGPDGSTILVGDEDSIADGLVQTRGLNADPAAQLEAESAIDRERSAKRVKGPGGGAATAGEDQEDDDVDMIGADTADAVDEAAEEDEDDEDATESEAEGQEAEEEDRVGTEPEDVDDEEDNEEAAVSDQDSD